MNDKELTTRQDVARQIREGRQAKGITQRDLAAGANTTPAVIARIELCQTSTTVDLLARISRVIKKDIVINHRLK